MAYELVPDYVDATVDGITGIGFLSFFVWMAAMGVSLLLGERAAASKTPPLASA